jgi:hypothetical protein
MEECRICDGVIIPQNHTISFCKCGATGIDYIFENNCYTAERIIGVIPKSMSMSKYNAEQIIKIKNAHDQYIQSHL